MGKVPKKLSSFSKSEIESLFKKARLKTKFPGLRILRSPVDKGCPFAKLLLITSRKVGNAVQRNLVRRRLRAIFREHKLFLLSHDIVIITDARVLSIPFLQLETLLVSAAQG